MDFSPHIAISGGADCSEEEALLSFETGQLLAQAGAVLLCGGMTGVMQEACRGAKSQGGTTIGILPGTDRRQANPYVDIALPTGMGEGRNFLLVRAADSIIAIGGGWGTLSEIALALRIGCPVIGLKTLEVVRDKKPLNDIIRAQNPHHAVELALSLAQKKRG